MVHRAGPRKKRGPRMGIELGGKKRGPAPPRSVTMVPRPASWCGAGREFCTGPWKIRGPARPGANANNEDINISFEKLRDYLYSLEGTTLAISDGALVSKVLSTLPLPW